MLLRSIKTQTKNRISLALFNSNRAFSLYTKDKFYNLVQLNDTRAELRETFEKFAQEECAPHAEEMDKTMVFPHEMWRKFGDMGMLGLTVEEEYGGMGLGYYEHCMAVEEVSKANAAMALSYLAHSNLCVNQIRLNVLAADQFRKIFVLLLFISVKSDLIYAEVRVG